MNGTSSLLFLSFSLNDFYDCHLFPAFISYSSVSKIIFYIIALGRFEYDLDGFESDLVCFECDLGCFECDLGCFECNLGDFESALSGFVILVTQTPCSGRSLGSFEFLASLASLETPRETWDALGNMAIFLM